MNEIQRLTIELAQAIAAHAMRTAHIDGIPRRVTIVRTVVFFTDEGPVIAEGVYDIIGESKKSLTGAAKSEQSTEDKPKEPLPDDLFNLVKDIADLGEL